MVSKFDHFFYVLIVSVLFMIQCSISSPLENDKLVLQIIIIFIYYFITYFFFVLKQTELTERFDRMQSKIEAEMVKNSITVVNFIF